MTGTTTTTADERRALAEAAGRDLEGASAQEVARWAVDTFGHDLVVAASMQDAVLPHLFAQLLPGVELLFLETGYHFPETAVMRDRVAAELPVRVIDVLPRLTVPQQDAEYGPRLHERDPGLCCSLRKVFPLAEALDGRGAWVTGVRRDEAPTRANTPVVTWDEKHHLVKVNPLVRWTLQDVEDYITEHQLPRHELTLRGYPSIGCAPCTRAVAPGEDPRSGRWSGTAKTECGIHT
ncbi:phosphoadenylylsulfate reductase (thioredoxin) [Quadrisphaera granulorum]|uniref:Adenosine 5'-phosphosulfate reductase n=1 Tax=Quadrisphaera granulorum TaxID=317664 RepID=A0A316AES0_9ACTN|nr:phosphoadenylyl-sulfate reductase [Quadrisphaera granulorum]PWJ56111.1 phosphoadenylylsulfate reductase (thioredoxin) [Quadrisphaera granulorum]SZE94745.1 phosphoadenylylsulfate reductase (thioredoxin) [Quadrisphaera granulorum]